MNNLGELYGNGLGTPIDEREAFRWHLAAARANNPAGVWNVALAYFTNRADGSDPSNAERYVAWRPNGVSEKDLMAPVLERTMFFGNALPADEIQKMRDSARQNVPVTSTFEQMRPDARIPTFQSRSRALTTIPTPQH